MKGKHRARVFLGAITAMVMACTAFSATANAAPAWYFDGVELKGTETIANGPPATVFSIPELELAIFCDPLPLEMTIWNTGGSGLGNVVELPFPSCTTSDEACTVEAAWSESLPWPAKLGAISSKNYLVITGVKIQMVFGGMTCPLYEVEATITGSAGGLVDNATERIKFSPATFKATGTALKMLGQPVNMEANLAMHATGEHSWQLLTVS